MAEYQGRKVELNKPSRIVKGDAGYGRKKFKVYVQDKDKVKKVMFGDPNLSIKRYSDKRRKSFRARHKCDTNTPKDKTKARYWSCRFWESRKTVTELLS
tara:strand:+ start:215 stop:511 length:297 start_codon:yes stop_codon:yes gene_type:complete